MSRSKARNESFAPANGHKHALLHIVSVLGLPLIIVWLGSRSVTRLFSLPVNCLELCGDMSECRRHNRVAAHDH